MVKQIMEGRHNSKRLV